MANIRVNLGGPVVDGQPVTFRSPANCSEVSGLIVYYPNGDTTASKTFQFADAHGNNVGSKNLFAADVLVKVILDTGKSRAYVQNADTNAYLEAQLASKAPAGFGLGKTAYAPTVDGVAYNADGISGNGFFVCKNGSPINDWCYVLHIQDESEGDNATQFCFMRYNWSGVTNISYDTIFKRIKIDSVWRPWEYVNPSMHSGVEYHTTERIAGKAVYKRNNNGIIEYRLDGETTWKPYANAVGAVAKQPINSEYNNIASVYGNAYGKCVQISLPTNFTGNGDGIVIELDVCQGADSSEGQYWNSGRIRISATTATSGSWYAARAYISGDLKGIQVFGKDRQHFYLTGLYRYCTVSIRKIMAGANVQWTNLLTTSVSIIDALPTGYTSLQTIYEDFKTSVPLPSAWVANGSDGWKQTVSVPGILASDAPIIGPMLGATTATSELIREEWSKVIGADTAADSITFFCGTDKPVCDLPIQIQCTR